MIDHLMIAADEQAMIGLLGSHLGLYTAGDPTNGIPVLLWSFLMGVKRTYLYQLIDEIPPDPTNTSANFCLVDFSLNLKPSYTAIKSLLALFNPKASTLPDLLYSIDCSVPYQSLIFKQIDHHMLFVWQVVSGWNNTNRTAIAPVNTPATLSFSGAPPTKILERHFTDAGTVSATWMTANADGTYTLKNSDNVTAYQIYP